MDSHLDENALAERWSISSRTLQRWRQTGQGPAFLKLGGRVVYRVVDVEAYERNNLRTSGSPILDSTERSR
jgi:predicted site-specific integrase-resolvase